MEIRTLYICSKVGIAHPTIEKPDTGMCPFCPENQFSFLTRIIDNSPKWTQEVDKKYEELKNPESKIKVFNDLIRNGDENLEKKEFQDALKKYEQALALKIDDKLAKEKIEFWNKEWEKEGKLPPPPPPPPLPDKEFGFAVLLMDASGSMDEPAFENSSLSKKQLIAKTAAHGIFDMKANKKSQDAFITGFMFDHEIKPILPLNSIANIVSSFEIPENLEKFILDKLNSTHGTTNINGALEVAYNQAKDFIRGDLKGLFGEDYNVMYHAVTDTKLRKNIQVPNVRVFLYTDGLQWINGKTEPLKNPFKDSSDFKVDVLMGGYFGAETGEGSEGVKELKDILSSCPEHGEKNFFLFEKPEKMGTLRNLFKMASGASGFCPKCLERVECELEYEKDRTR